jgi:hypothetical protein
MNVFMPDGSYASLDVTESDEYLFPPKPLLTRFRVDIFKTTTGYAADSFKASLSFDIQADPSSLAYLKMLREQGYVEINGQKEKPRLVRNLWDGKKSGFVIRMGDSDQEVLGPRIGPDETPVSQDTTNDHIGNRLKIEFDALLEKNNTSALDYGIAEGFHAYLESQRRQNLDQQGLLNIGVQFETECATGPVVVRAQMPKVSETQVFLHETQIIESSFSREFLETVETLRGELAGKRLGFDTYVDALNAALMKEKNPADQMIVEDLR